MKFRFAAHIHPRGAGELSQAKRNACLASKRDRLQGCLSLVLLSGDAGRLGLRAVVQDEPASPEFHSLFIVGVKLGDRFRQ
jgi:hypothetical protein